MTPEQLAVFIAALRIQAEYCYVTGRTNEPGADDDQIKICQAEVYTFIADRLEEVARG